MRTSTSRDVSDVTGILTWNITHSFWKGHEPGTNYHGHLEPLGSEWGPRFVPKCLTLVRLLWICQTLPHWSQFPSFLRMFIKCQDENGCFASVRNVPLLFESMKMSEDRGVWLELRKPILPWKKWSTDFKDCSHLKDSSDFFAAFQTFRF